MAYEALLDILPAGDGVTVTTLPDGSVDRYFRVQAGEEYLESREVFGERVAAGAESFRTEHRQTRPGGQSVNMAQQATALGNETTVYGHLDHAIFGPLPAEAVSMGKPAVVSVLSFDHGDLMLSEESSDILSWGLDDLTEVADLQDVFDVDVVCWGNWVSLPGATEALDALSRRVDSPDAWFVFDPGNVTNHGDAELGRLFDVLGRLDGPFDVALSADRGEIERLAAVVDTADADDPRLLEAVRERAGISGVVLHEAPRAHVATRAGYRSVENFDAEHVERTAGAGDRFTAGLGHALGHGWGWQVGLELGNACASTYVETGETGSRAEILEYVRERR